MRRLPAGTVFMLTFIDVAAFCTDWTDLALTSDCDTARLREYAALYQAKNHESRAKSYNTENF